MQHVRPGFFVLVLEYLTSDLRYGSPIISNPASQDAMHTNTKLKTCASQESDKEGRDLPMVAKLMDVQLLPD